MRLKRIMNKVIGISVLVLTALLFACTSYSGSEHQQSDHVGNITEQELLESYSAFQQEYHQFQLTEQQKQQVSEINQALTIDIYFGTWCHDSEREVPRMLKALKEQPNISVNLVALDYEKQEPQGRAKANSIRFTPTFIIKNEQGELGRIIERPKLDLISDLVHITDQQG